MLVLQEHFTGDVKLRDEFIFGSANVLEHLQQEVVGLELAQ